MNREEAVPAPDQWYGTIDKAVEYLQECKRKGQNVYIEFNGNILYSADVTLDSAYLQITGLTKEESDKAQEELSGTTTIKDGKFYTDEEKEKAIVDKYKKIEQGHIEEAKKSATPAEKTYLGNIENAVAYLQECKRKGKNVYVDFNGHKLYSSDVTIDSAYMEVVGMTKAEDEAIRAEYSQAKTEEEKEAIIAKWDSIRKAHAEAGDKKRNKTVLDSAIEATEETTKTSTINGQAQSIKDVSKGKDEKVEETEIVE